VRDQEIKIHHLLTHTSGIPALGYAEMVIDTYYGFRTDALLSIATPDDVLVYMSEYEKHPRFKPGERWFYLNEGYVLLGKIIEKTSGLKYEEYVKREIAKKLQLEKFYFTREEYTRDRFSADGGSWPFMFSDFMALHHLPLNGFL
jgi:CubicO group peptidase (beta-lactamase class C family)